MIKLNTKPNKERWQRVVDEGFLVENVNNPGKYFILENTDGNLSELQIVRKIGIRQPHFKGQPHPTGHLKLFVVNSEESCLVKEGIQFAGVNNSSPKAYSNLLI